MAWNLLRGTYHALLFAKAAKMFEKAYYSGNLKEAQSIYEGLSKHGIELGECVTEDYGGRASLRFIVEICGMKLKSGLGEISHEEYQNYLELRLEQLDYELRTANENRNV